VPGTRFDLRLHFESRRSKLTSGMRRRLGRDRCVTRTSCVLARDGNRLRRQKPAKLTRAPMIPCPEAIASEAKANKRPRPVRFEENRALIEWEIETLKAEGEEYLRLMRELPRR
jgi:hypothetical protein